MKIHITDFWFAKNSRCWLSLRRNVATCNKVLAIATSHLNRVFYLTTLFFDNFVHVYNIFLSLPYPITTSSGGQSRVMPTTFTVLGSLGFSDQNSSQSISLIGPGFYLVVYGFWEQDYLHLFKFLCYIFN